MLESRYISSREGLEGESTSFRAFLKSASAVGEGQQLLLRGTILAEEWGSQGCGRYHRDLHLFSDCDWDGAGGLTPQNHWGTASGNLSLFGISVTDLYLIHTFLHADFPT